jgi:hypothetical protein
MTDRYAQDGALFRSWVAINCYNLPQIVIELLHFHYTHWGLAPPHTFY